MLQEISPGGRTIMAVGNSIHADLEKIKVLLKRVCGKKPGKGQAQLLRNFVVDNLRGKKDCYGRLLEINWEDWGEQLENGLINPVYQVYHATLQSCLTHFVQLEIKGFLTEYDQAHELMNGSCDIVPLIAIFSVFSGCRISIYPYPEGVLETLQGEIRDLTEDKTEKKINAYIEKEYPTDMVQQGALRSSIVQYARLSKLDVFLSRLQMSQALCATESGQNIKFKCPHNVGDRTEIFKQLRSIRPVMSIDAIGHQPSKKYVEQIAKGLEKVESKHIDKDKPSQCVDYSLSSLLSRGASN